MIPIGMVYAYGVNYISVSNSEFEKKNMRNTIIVKMKKLETLAGYE